LLDYPEKVACTVFLGGCDFRCPFCHNSELIGEIPDTIEEAEFFSFLKKRHGLLDGGAVTGGEPLLRRDLPDFLAKIKELGYLIKLDTNGNHPDALQAILEDTLADYVAMDIKNSPERYGETIGTPDFNISDISRSISLLLNGSVTYEFRTTVVAEFHDNTSFPAIGQWIQGAERYYLQCFTDRDTVLQPGLHAPSETDLRRYAELVKPYVQKVQLRGV
ncbi:MAG: anaerobic ribonucleoside-triphosphate reductase activating protein, partial [Clostridiales bacterium]|nr:anaerobic ribonucleoside-triphosphate reductase activating protein [Clostridiales bacterium]